MFVTRSNALAVLAAAASGIGIRFPPAEKVAVSAVVASPVLLAAPSKEDDLVVQLIHFTFAAADTHKAEAMLRELRAASLKEDGVLGFDVARSQDRPNVFVLWEQYRDSAAQQAHIASEHFKRLVINGVRTLAEQRNAELLDPI